MSSDGNKSTKRVPFTMFSSSAGGGYLDDLHANFTDGVTLANMHVDTYGDFRNPPMQGPFTEKHVGGMPHRHTKIILAGDLEFITNSIDEAEGYWDETPVYVTPLDTPPVGADTVWELDASGDLTPLASPTDNTIWEVVDADTAIAPGEPDIASYWRVYKTDCKPEGYYIIPAAGKLNLYAPDFRSDVPRSWLYRDEFAKRPLNIRNIKTEERCNGVGNFTKEYEVVQIAGRTLNPRHYAEHPEQYTTNYALNYGTEGKVFNNLTGALNTPATGTLSEYTLPDNTGSLNNFVFVNRFSAPGDRYTMSRGFLNPKGEELSAYNASPFRNLNVRKELSEDLATHTPKATDIPPSSSTKYHTTNRNTRLQKFLSGSSSDVVIDKLTYDDGYTTHAIPRSTLQYSWVTASAETTRSEFPGFATGSDIQFYSNSVGFSSPMNNVYIDPVNATQSFDFTGSAYTYGTWKQIRGGELALSRHYRKNNILPVANVKDEVSQFIEPPVVARNFPLEYVVAIDSTGAPYKIKSSYGSLLQRYSNEEVNKLAGIKTSDKDTRYSQIKKLYLEKSVTDANNPIKAFYSLTYGQTLYPKDENAFMGKVRLRGKYTEVPGTGSNGYDRLYGTQNTMYSSTSMRDATARNSQGNVDISLAFDPMGTDGINSFPDGGSYSGNVGELNLDTDVSLTSSDAPTSSLDFFETNYLSFLTQSNVGPYFPEYLVSTDYNERLVEQMSGKKRWYDSYEDYTENTRGIMKEASILPEFRISEHMEYYTNDSAGNFRAENKNFLSLLGAEYSSSATSPAAATFDANFEKTYINSDELASLDKIKKDHVGYAKPSKITLKASGVKKLLPYNGFYPDTRTVQLGNLLSSSLADNIVGFKKPNPNSEISEALLVKANEQGYASFLKTLASPGVLYNSIKAGIAVGYPAYLETPQTKSFLENPTSVLSLSSSSSSSVEMVPFESLVNLNQSLPVGSNIHLVAAANNAGSALSGNSFATSSLYYGRWDGNKKPNFELGMHNFLAESVQFFLNNGQLNTFSSKPSSEFADVVAGKEYYMDVLLRDRVAMNKFVEYGTTQISFPIVENLSTDTDTYDLYPWGGGEIVSACAPDGAYGVYSIYSYRGLYRDNIQAGAPANNPVFLFHTDASGSTILLDTITTPNPHNSSPSGPLRDGFGCSLDICSGSSGIHFIIGADLTEKQYLPAIPAQDPCEGDKYAEEQTGCAYRYSYSPASQTTTLEETISPLWDWALSTPAPTCTHIGALEIELPVSCSGVGTAVGICHDSESQTDEVYWTVAARHVLGPTGSFGISPYNNKQGAGVWFNAYSPGTPDIGYFTCKVLDGVYSISDPGDYGTHLSLAMGAAWTFPSYSNIRAVIACNWATGTGGVARWQVLEPYCNSPANWVTFSQPNCEIQSSMTSPYVNMPSLAYEEFDNLPGISDEIPTKVAAVKHSFSNNRDEFVFAVTYPTGSTSSPYPEAMVHVTSLPLESSGAPYPLTGTMSMKVSNLDLNGSQGTPPAIGLALNDYNEVTLALSTYDSSEETPGLDMYSEIEFPITAPAPTFPSAAFFSTAEIQNARPRDIHFETPTRTQTMTPFDDYTKFISVSQVRAGYAPYYMLLQGPRAVDFKQHGRLFGNPVDGMYDPAYIQYTPPGFYGESVARISFSSSVGGSLTVGDILNSINIEEVLELTDDKVRKSIPPTQITAEQEASKMSLRESLNLKGKINQPDIQFSISEDGNVSIPDRAVKQSTDNLCWAISTKYECPVLDVSSSSYAENYTSNLVSPSSPYWGGITGADSYVKTPQSVWTSYGKQVSPNDGYDFELRDTPGTSINDGSLIELCGFTAGTKKIGTVADKKTISEAIMVIPYVDRKIPFKTVEIEKGKHFIRFSKTELKRQKKNVEDKGYAISEDNPTTSISELISGMKNYVIPPQYNFLQYEDIKPFAAYFLEFDHELSQRDLIDIWQGVMPTIAMNPETDEVEITHNFDAHNFFHNMEFPTDIKFMVFKVKKKANWNYYSITADSTDDTRFKFDFQGDGKVEVVPDYNYNWPYDYCSLVDRAKVDVSVTFERDEGEEEAQ